MKTTLLTLLLSTAAAAAMAQEATTFSPHDMTGAAAQEAEAPLPAAEDMDTGEAAAMQAAAVELEETAASPTEVSVSGTAAY